MRSLNVTPKPRSWVTATVKKATGRLRPARVAGLPKRALWVLDLAAQGNATVYEDGDFKSWAIDGQRQVHEVTREVDRLYSGSLPMLVPGHWVGVGGAARRRWEVTAYGQTVLVAAGRIRQAHAIEAGVS